MKEFNEVMEAVKELLNGAKCVLIPFGNVRAFVAVCEAFNIRINGGAYDFEGNKGQYFYGD